MWHSISVQRVVSTKGNLVAHFILAAVLIAATASYAALPDAGAEADATAKWETIQIPSELVTSSAIAQQTATIPLSGDFSLATGTAVLPEGLGGPIVRGYTEVLGAFPNSQGGGSMEATSHARVMSHFEATGTGPIDLDVEIHISGSLEGGNYFSGSLGNVTSHAIFQATLHTENNSFPLFFGDAFFDASANAASSILTTSGDWSTSDFTVFDPGNFNNQGRIVNLNDPNEDVVILNPGDRFAIELLLNTDVFASGPFEAAARADFDSTGAIALSTDAQGATFVQLAVPEPTSFACLLLGAGVGFTLLRR